jgi:hypothetical protein
VLLIVGIVMAAIVLNAAIERRDRSVVFAVVAVGLAFALAIGFVQLIRLLRSSSR